MGVQPLREQSLFMKCFVLSTDFLHLAWDNVVMRYIFPAIAKTVLTQCNYRSVFYAEHSMLHNNSYYTDNLDISFILIKNMPCQEAILCP